MTMTVTRRIQADKVAISLLCLFDARIPWRSRLMAVAWPGRWAYVLFWWVVLKGSWDLGTMGLLFFTHDRCKPHEPPNVSDTVGRK